MDTQAIPEIPVGKLDPEVVRSWRTDGLVFLVGSFISTFPPTNLPAGGQIADALWSYIFCWPNWFRQDFSSLPFEALIEHYPDREAARIAIRDMFSTEVKNPIHECLAEQLRSGTIEAIITTNYDRCLDACLTENSDRVITIFKKEHCDRYAETRSLPNRPRVYFKIHGTAEPREEDSLVFCLEGEAELPEWKRDMLQSVTAGRTLVLVGYSGRDFDICPFLWSVAQPARVVWLQPSVRSLQPNALQVLRQKNGSLVSGERTDLLPDFLRTVIGRKIDVGPAEQQQSWRPDSYFDPRHVSNWRIRILNWVACPSLGLPLLSDFTGGAPERSELESSMYGHIGLYRKAILIKKRNLKTLGQTDEQRLRSRVDLASCWFIYGRPFRAWLQLWRAECEAKRRNNTKMRVTIAERKVMMISRLINVFDQRPFRAISYKGDEQTARDGLVATGNLGGLQGLKDNWERAGAGTDAGLILPSRHGYSNLGLVSLNVNANRQWIRSWPWRLTKRKEDAARACIKKAELYGWRHEAWKLRWILLWRGSGPLNWHDLSLWWQDFRRTEYPLFFRLYLLVRQLVLTCNSDEPFLVVREQQAELSDNISPLANRLK